MFKIAQPGVSTLTSIMGFEPKQKPAQTGKEALLLAIVGLVCCMASIDVARAESSPSGKDSVMQTSTSAQLSRGGGITVGPADNCDYDNLQDAIDNATGGFLAVNILVQAEYLFNFAAYEIIGPGEDLIIVGGFPDCDGFSEMPDQRTTLDAAGVGRLFDIRYEAQPGDPSRFIRLVNFTLQSGLVGPPGSPIESGGGLRIHGRPGLLGVALENVRVSNNISNNGDGGGIYMRTTGDQLDVLSAPLLSLDDTTSVSGNEAALNGGGISCVGLHDQFSPILQTGAGLISNNQSSVNGGGVSLDGCLAELRNGKPMMELIPIGLFHAGGIVENQADRRGGGLYARGGTIVTVIAASDQYGGDPDTAALIMDNESARGGGIYARDPGTEVHLLDVVVRDNEALDETFGFGGGMMAIDEARITMDRLDDGDAGASPCMPIEYVTGIGLKIPPCSRLSRNSSRSDSGAIRVNSGAEVQVRNTHIFDNSVESFSGRVLNAFNLHSFEGPPARAVFTNTLMANNSGGISLITAGRDSEVEVRWSTIWETDHEEADYHTFRLSAVTDTSSTFNLIGSIVWGEPTGVLVSTSGDGNTAAHARCVIGYQPASQGGWTSFEYFSSVDPEFEDPSGNRFHLQPNSPAINYCDDAEEFPPRDLDGRMRDVAFDGPISPPPGAHPDGWLDLGALVIADLLFGDRFESH